MSSARPALESRPSSRPSHPATAPVRPPRGAPLDHSADRHARPWCLHGCHQLVRRHHGAAEPRHPGGGTSESAAGPGVRRRFIASQAVQIDDRVVLVGHSYGGAVISMAGTADNVVGLVCIAAYVPEEGESLDELQGRFPLPPLASSLQGKTYPVDDGQTAVEVTIEAEAFPVVYAADVPLSTTKVLATTQRPLAASSFTQRASAVAWKSKPSWALVAGADAAINPEVECFGAERAGAVVIEVDDASHAVLLSRPVEVAEFIRDAVRATT
ncbi:alpha/beta hydrolase [Streptomyces sp. NPDC001732]